ncbi:hypothetical protein LUZ60_005802 [Juncus effusus]|nr:hypothetical protein LUZ60_005802 [Juncus effusus]
MKGGLEEEELQQLRSRATELLLKEDWTQYINLYTHLISLCDPNNNRKTLVSALSNRAEAWFKLKNPVSALKDCDLALSLDPAHVKTLISKGKILLELAHYSQASDCFRKVKLLSNGSQNEIIRGLLEKCQKLGTVSRTGLIDLSEWILSGFVSKFPDLAEFVGPIELKQTGQTGRGLFLTKNVEAGSVLMVTKAVAIGRAILPNENGQMVMWKDFVDKFLSKAEKCKKTLNLINQLSNGDLNTELSVPNMNLFRSELERERETDYEKEELDLDHALKVLDVNCLTEESFSARVLGKNLGYKGVGLWGLPSFINHSCNPNVRRLHVGDWVILHASRDIKSQEEINFAYFDVLRPVRERKDLVKRWGFECKCDRCRFETKALGLFQELKELEDRFVNSSDLGGLVVKLEELMRKLPLKERERGFIRASFWGGYSYVFNSERLVRKFGRKIPEPVRVVQSIFETVGSDERILKVLRGRMKNGGNGGLDEMERIMRVAKGTYGKVMKRQTFRVFIEEN